MADKPYKLHPKRHSSVERDQWLNTIVLEYVAKGDQQDSFEVFGSDYINDICFWIAESLNTLDILIGKEDCRPDIPPGKYSIRVDYEHDVPLCRYQCTENKDNSLVENILRRAHFELYKDWKPVQQRVIFKVVDGMSVEDSSLGSSCVA